MKLCATQRSLRVRPWVRSPQVAIFIKHDEFRIKNDEFCIKIDGFCIKNDDLNTNRSQPHTACAAWHRCDYNGISGFLHGKRTSEDVETT